MAGVVLLSALPRDWGPARADCALPRELAARAAATGGSEGGRARLDPGERWSSAASCAPRDGGGRPLRGPSRLLFGRRLDLNRAGAGALEVLPGIGPARAIAILEGREARPFASVQDLERVRGIGPGTVRALGDWVEVSVPRAQGPVACGAGCDLESGARLGGGRP